jgi:hypothetical protein
MIELVRPANLIYRLSSWCDDQYYLFFTPPLRGDYLKTDKTNWELALKGSIYLIGRLDGDEFYSSRGCQVYIFCSDNPKLLFSTPWGSPFGWIRRYEDHYYYFVVLPSDSDYLKVFINDDGDIMLFEEWKGNLEIDRRNDPGYGWWELKPPRSGGSGESGGEGEDHWLMMGMD